MHEETFLNTHFQDGIIASFKAKLSHGLFDRCIGSAFGLLHVLQRPSPTAIGVRHATSYVQAVVAVGRHFLVMDISAYVSTYDSIYL